MKKLVSVLISVGLGLMVGVAALALFGQLGAWFTFLALPAALVTTVIALKLLYPGENESVS